MPKKKVFSPPEPFMQIRSNALIFYKLFPSGSNKKGRGFANCLYKDDTQKPKQTYQGFASFGARKRIKRTVDILIQLSPERIAINPVTHKKIKHRLSFITLTMSSRERHIEPAEANKILLAPFIRVLRAKHNLKTYIWKAEFQKNGQLHYHITTPSIIHYQYIKDNWNNLLCKNNLLTEYHKRYPSRMPNSTDIRSVYKKRDLSWYLSKEISKNIQDKRTTGKIWDCSNNIKGRKFFSIIEPSDLAGILDDKKIIHTDFCGIYKELNMHKAMNKTVREKYNQWRQEIIKGGLF